MKKHIPKLIVFTTLLSLITQLHMAYALSSDGSSQQYFPTTSGDNVEASINTALCTDPNGNVDSSCLAGALVSTTTTTTSGAGGGVVIPATPSTPVTTKTTTTGNQQAPVTATQTTTSTDTTNNAATAEPLDDQFNLTTPPTAAPVTDQNTTQNTTSTTTPKKDKTSQSVKKVEKALKQAAESTLTDATPSVLGVSTQRVDYKNYYNQLFGNLTSLENQEQNSDNIYSQQEILYIFFAAVLAFLALYTENRYQKISKQYLQLQTHSVKKNNAKMRK